MLAIMQIEIGHVPFIEVPVPIRRLAPVVVSDLLPDLKILSKNPKGYFLVIHSDTHIPDAKKTLSRLVDLDKITKSTVEQAGKNTLVIFTADHSYGLYLSRHKEKQPKSRDILPMVTLDNDHTAEEVPLFAFGPEADKIKGFIPNTQVFHFMMSAYGWKE